MCPNTKGKYGIWTCASLALQYFTVFQKTCSYLSLSVVKLKEVICQCTDSSIMTVGRVHYLFKGVLYRSYLNP